MTRNCTKKLFLQRKCLLSFKKLAMPDVVCSTTATASLRVSSHRLEAFANIAVHCSLLVGIKRPHLQVCTALQHHRIWIELSESVKKHRAAKFLRCAIDQCLIQILITKNRELRNPSLLKFKTGLSNSSSHSSNTKLHQQTTFRNTAFFSPSRVSPNRKCTISARSSTLIRI